jgi:hypothetical protein
MGNYIIGSCYVGIAVVAVVMELMPRIQTESVFTKVALLAVSFGALVKADQYL